MRRFLYFMFFLLFLSYQIRGQEPEMVTPLGRWAEGRCEAVFRRNGYTFIGNGGYLEVYRSQSGSYERLDAVLMPGPVKDIWVRGGADRIYVACGDEGLQIVNFNTGTHRFGGIIGERDTDGFANGVMDRYVNNRNYVFIADGTNGLVIVDVQNPSSPVQVGTYSTSGFAHEVWVYDDSTVFVAAGSAGLYSINTSTLSNPSFFDSLSFSTVVPGRAPVVYSVITIGSVAYVATGWGGMRTVNVSTRDDIQQLGIWTSSEVEVFNVWVSGDYAYLTCGEKGLYAPINISDPSQPSGPGFLPLDTGGFSSVIMVDQDTAFVGDGYNGHLLIDVVEGFQPSFIDSVESADITCDVTVSSGYGYVAAGRSGLRVFDLNISNPPDDFLEEVSFYDTPGEARGIVKSGSWVYVADGSWGLTILDALYPTDPTFHDEFVTQGDTCYNVDISGNYAFLACGSDGIRVINISGTIFEVPGSPFSTPGSARDIKIVDDKAYIADTSGVYVYQITGLPSNFTGMNTIDSFTTDVEACGIDALDNRVYVANGEYGFFVWDLSAGSIQRIETGGTCTDIAVKDKTIYIVDSQDGLGIFDYSRTELLPDLVGYQDTGGRPRGLAVTEDRVCVADGEDGLYVFESEIRPELLVFSCGQDSAILNFGPVPHGQTRPLNLWIANVGTALLVGQIAVPQSIEGEFHLSTGSVEISPKDTLKLVVIFEPEDIYSIGVLYNSILSIQSNDPDNPNRGIDIYWEGGRPVNENPLIPDVFTVGLWHFNETVGITAGDTSGNGLHGQLHGAPTRIVSKTGFGRAISFDGINDWIEIPSDPLLNFWDSPFTAELWFSMSEKPVQSGYYIMLKRGNGATQQVELALGMNEGVMARVWRAVGVADTLTTGSMDELNTDQWYHVALTWDCDSLRLFLNGVLRDREALGMNLINVAAEPLAVGSSSILNVPFNGKIDEVRISCIARQPWEFHVNMSELVLDDTFLHFGDVLLQKSRHVPLTIRNGGSQNLVVSSLSTTNESVEVTQQSGFTLETGQRRVVWLTFTPDSEDSLGANDFLIIESSDPTFPQYYMQLMGRGVTTIQAGAYNTDPFTLGLWHLDETQGAVVYDASVNEMNGTWNGITRTLGKFSRCLLFDGQNDICVIKPETHHQIGSRWGGFTVESWFRIESGLPGEKGILVRRGRDSSYQFDLIVTGTVVEGCIFNTNQDSFRVTSSSLEEGIQVNKWYHTAMALDQDTLRLYVNGDEIDKKPFTGEFVGSEEGTPFDTLSVLVGRDWEGEAPFRGNIDEVRISGIGRQFWEFNVNMARVRVSTHHMDFGNVLLGSERILKLWISNPGIDVLEVYDISSSNPVFELDTTSFSLLPGHRQLVRVMYKPSNTGFQSGQLTLDSNDPFIFQPVLLVGQGIATRSLTQYESDPHTLALYHFNNVTDSTVWDSSGAGLYGTLKGGVAWSESGRFGGALSFDGLDDWVEIPYDTSSNLANSDFTVELWFSMVEKPERTFVLMRRGDGDTIQVELILNVYGGLMGSVWDSAGEQHTLSTGSMDTLNTDQWYHAAFSWDGDSLRLYMNNEVRDTKPLSGSLRIEETPFALGASSQVTQSFRGYIDEFRISSVARLMWEFNVSPTKIEVTPTRLDFPTVIVGQSRTLQFGVKNQGDQDLVVSSIIGGADRTFSFPELYESFVLPRLQTLMIPVTYRPANPNTIHRDTLNIACNDENRPTVSVALGGSSTDAQNIGEFLRDSHTLALFHFNEGEGSASADSSGGGYDAQLNGATWAEGYFGNGLFFDGVNDWVEIQADSNFVFNMASESFSVECFFRTDTVSHALIFKGFEDADNDVDYGVLIDQGGRLEVEGFGSGGPRVSDGSWHHVAFTYDHTDSKGRLYVDGIQVWIRDWINTNGSMGDRPVILGAAEQSVGGLFQYFEGYLDEVRISDIVRHPWEFPYVDYQIEVDSLYPDPPELDQELTMEIHVPVGLGATGVVLYYRGGGSNTYHEQVGVELDDSTYQVVLPATVMTLYGLEYYVGVTTGDGDTLTYPFLDPKNNPAAEVVRHPEMEADLTFHSQRLQGGDSEFQLISMFSIPFQLDSTDVVSVLEDDLGPYDPYKWRLFWWHRVNSQYVDYRDQTQPQIFNFTPGRAFWLVLDSEQIIDIGMGQTVTTDSHYPIMLQGGWNMIGTPYYFTVGWDDCFLTSDSISTLYYYDGENGYRLDWPIMEPWKGYFVYHADSVDVSDTLFVLPRQIPDQTGLGKERIVKRGVLHNLQEEEWLFKLSVETKGAKDLDNFAGVRRDAKDGWDLRDRLEPPPVGNGIALYFEHTDWKRHSGILAADIRKAGERGYVWEFIVKTLFSKQSVGIHWSLHQTLPDGWEAYLFDLDETISTNLLKEDAVTFEAGKEVPDLHRFKLVVGTKEYIENHREGIPLEQVRFFLYQNYPNPFNPETQIHYSLPKKDEVRITIFNAIGRRVRVLVQGKQNAGHHHVVWDGRDDRGRLVSSGIYLCKLEASKMVATRKMVFLK